jgi:hypothetical protein
MLSEPRRGRRDVNTPNVNNRIGSESEFISLYILTVQHSRDIAFIDEGPIDRLDTLCHCDFDDLDTDQLTGKQSTTHEVHHIRTLTKTGKKQDGACFILDGPLGLPGTVS